MCRVLKHVVLFNDRIVLTSFVRLSQQEDVVFGLLAMLSPWLNVGH